LDLAAKKAGLQTFKHTQDGLTDKEKNEIVIKHLLKQVAKQNVTHQLLLDTSQSANEHNCANV